MIFNFFLGNHAADSLNSLGDLVEPIYRGLEANGHHVIAFGTGMRDPPAVNVFVEFFEDDAVANAILSAKAQHGAGFRFGIVCTEDIEDALVMDPAKYPRRRANLLRLLPQADFVWTLLPVAAYEEIAGAGKVGLLEYGFSEACANPIPVQDRGLRDVDVIIYGNRNPYRAAIGDALQQQGLTVFFGHRETFPTFVSDDIICRAKVLIDIRRGPGVRFLSPTRIVKGLHCGTAVVSEQFDTSPIANLYRYTLACPYEQLVERTLELVRSGMFLNVANASRQRFRAETSMATNIGRLLQMPSLARLGAA